MEERNMPEDRNALLEHYRQTRDALLSAIHGLSDELMTERSLDGWFSEGPPGTPRSLG